MSNLHEKLQALIEEIVISEMPISTFKRVGNWNKASSFGHKTDRALLTSPKAVEKIHRQWEKTPYDFALYLVNDPRVNKSEFREVGEVDDKFIQRMGLTPEEFPGKTPETITIIFTNNVGDQRYMASGWILAHRVGHVFARSNGVVGQEWRFFTDRLTELFKEMLGNVYDLNIARDLNGTDGQLLKLAAQQLGTMKSARDTNLRNWFEFAYELFAQYLLTGGIKLNPLPDRLHTKQLPFGRKGYSNSASPTHQRMYNNHDLEYYSGELEMMIENVLEAAKGRMFVM